MPTAACTGTYSGVSSNFAFLTPSLSYDANNVFLTLALQGSTPFSGFGGNTVNQRSVGSALDASFAGATGDFATVIGALAGLSTAQAGPALNAISGQPYADFGSFNVANNALFMNALGQQMALARGGRGGGQRQALAEACDVAACDGASPFSVWGSALGGVGSVQGDGNASTFTYNVGGTAAGIDYRLMPSLLLGLSAAYTNGTQWVDSFQGKGWSNTVSVAAYASFTQWGFYADALAGYAYSNNQLQRQISVPGLQPRTANGSTGANQFLAQVETGYAIAVYQPAAATLTPFARFQASSINQAAFSEWGANSLSLNLAQQTTTSLRTTLGADLAGCPRARRHAHARPRPAAGLAARIRQHGAADHGGVRRRPLGQLHRLRRHAAARRGGDRLPGQHQRRRRHAALPALRRRDRLGHRQPRAQSRRAPQLVRAARPFSDRREHRSRSGRSCLPGRDW